MEESTTKTTPIHAAVTPSGRVVHLRSYANLHPHGGWHGWCKNKGCACFLTIHGNGEVYRKHPMEAHKWHDRWDGLDENYAPVHPDILARIDQFLTEYAKAM